MHLATRGVMRGLVALAVLASTVGLQVWAAPPTNAIPPLTTFEDINPDASTNPSANSSTGGRANGLASASADNQVLYSASEFGGLFKSTDGGANWDRLDGHLPTVMWDVEVDPTDNNVVYATSFYDGRATSVAGIQVSGDAGATWVKPASATPPVASSATFGGCSALRRDEPAAFGIAIDPTDGDAFVGTNCGVARSTDDGATWAHSDPTPATTASDVWDAFVVSNGDVIICGTDGVHRSTDGGATWNDIDGGLPGGLSFGLCSIAASPDEAAVLFVQFGGRVFESDDTGTTWTEFAGSGDGTRIPFITVNDRTTGFDLWVGRGVNLFRAPCTTGGPGNRCPAVGSWVNAQSGAHADTGDVVFDTGAATDACPRLYSSDGGVHTNTVGASPGCHTPTWQRSNAGHHALWLYTMAGADQPGDDNEDLYFGLQDNGAVGTTTAGADSPAWNFPSCCDVFNIAASPTQVVWDFFSGYNQLYDTPGMASPSNVVGFAPGTATQGVDLFTFPDNIDTFGADSYVSVSGSGAFTTTDITVNPVVWTALGSGVPAGGFCGVQVAEEAGTPTFYAQTGCLGVRENGANRGPFQLWRLEGLTGTWEQVDDTFGNPGEGIEIFAVDPADPDRLFASHLSGPDGARMIRSNDGGDSWQVDTGLTALMDGGGDFPMQNTIGATSFTTRNGYVQPSLVAFDPEDPNVIVAGGRDSGVFFTRDDGASWELLTDPRSPHVTGAPHLPRPFYAYFDHEPTDEINIFIGTQGRGVWRIAVPDPVCPDTPPPGAIVGTSGNDKVVGTGGDDVIYGLAGDDVISAGGGNDTICGGPGNDRITGGAGNDTVDGGPGADRITGDGGNDRLIGGESGPNTVTGGDGDDILHLANDAGGDRFHGGTGTDDCTSDVGDQHLGGCS